MERILSKIAIILLVCASHQAQGFDSWGKLAGIAGSAVGAYGLYLRHQSLNNLQKAIEKDDRATIDEIKRLVKLNQKIQLHPALVNNLDTMCLLPGSKLDTTVRPALNDLINRYNSQGEASAGTELVDKLEALYANKLREISADKWRPLVIAGKVYGGLACCCFLFGLIGGSESSPGASGLSNVGALAARSITFPAKLFY